MGEILCEQILLLINIYLDQNKWIDLALADVGDPRGNRYSGVLKSARRAVKETKVSFKLSSLNVIENWNPKSHARRLNVARIMRELSNWNTLERDSSIVDQELDFYFQERFLETSKTVIQPFGQGPKSLLPPEFLSDLERFGPFQKLMEHVLEKVALEGPPGDFSDFGIDNSLFRVPTQKYAKVEQEIEQELYSLGLSPKKRTDAALSRVLTDFNKPIVKALLRNGLHPRVLEKGGAQELLDFVKRVPVLDVYFHLLALRYKNKDLKKTANDLPDISALRVAVPYCDVVVTEKLWTNLLNRSNFAEKKYATRVFHDLIELEDIIRSELP